MWPVDRASSEPLAQRAERHQPTPALAALAPLPGWARRQFDRIVEALAGKLPTVSDHLETARADILAFTALPKALWRQA